MSVVLASHFDGIVDRNYRNARKKLFEEARSLLKDHEKIRISVEGFANKLLSKAMASGIQKALSEGRSNVAFEINVAKEASRLWGSYPPKLKAQLPVDLIVLGLELVFADAGFKVDMAEHAIQYDRPIPEKTDTQKTEVVKEPAKEESLNSLLEKTPALPGPSESSSAEENEEREEEDEEEGDEEEEEEGQEDPLDGSDE